MGPLVRCPTHQISSNGSCVCELGYSAWKKGENSVECRECLKCDPSKCLARNTECNNKIPFNKTVTQKCVQPTQDHYSYRESGDSTPCRPSCSKNERETQTCGCNQDRKCECEIGFYRAGPRGDCSNVCGKCFSDLQTRVPIGECLDVPSNQRCIDKTPEITLKIIKTTSAKASKTDNSAPQTQRVTSPPINKLVTSTPSAVNVPLPTNSEISIQPSTVPPFGTFFVIVASIILCVAIATVVKYAWKKLKIHLIRGDATSQLLTMTDNTAIVEVEDEKGELTVSDEELLYEIEEHILQCQCKDWSVPFCEHVGEVLHVECNENLNKFLYNVFDQRYLVRKRIYMKSFKDVIAHLRAYKPETFTTEDLILKLSRLRGCEGAVKNIREFIRNDRDNLLNFRAPGYNPIEASVQDTCQ